MIRKRKGVNIEIAFNDACEENNINFPNITIKKSLKNIRSRSKKKHGRSTTRYHLMPISKRVSRKKIFECQNQKKQAGRA